MSEHRGEEQRRMPRASLPRRPPAARRGLPHPRGCPGPHPVSLPVPRCDPRSPAAVLSSVKLSKRCTRKPICCLSKGAAPANCFFCFTLPDLDTLLTSPRRHIISNRSPLLPNFPHSRVSIHYAAGIISKQESNELQILPSPFSDIFCYGCSRCWRKC